MTIGTRSIASPVQRTLGACASLALAMLPQIVAPITAVGGEATAETLRGEQIFAHGTSPSGDAITAYVGAESVELPASAMPCASCHGEDGRGRPEGGVTPSDITWSHLTKSYGHRHEYGRNHPAFNAESAVAAIAGGIDPAGNRLNPVMPRYDMSADDMSALLDYLQQLESRADPGLTSDSITLGTLLPVTGPAASLGNVLSAVTAAFIDELNAKGGIHGRTIELAVVPLGDTRDDALIHLEQAIANDEIFALLGAYGDGIEEPLFELVEQHRVPLIGPLTARLPAASSLSRYTFNLLAAREQQVRVLVDFAADRAEDARVIGTIAGPDTPELAGFTAAADAQGREHGWAELGSFTYAPGTLDADRLATTLSVGGSQALFFFGSPGELSRVLDAASRAGQAPAVFLLPDTVTPSLFDAPPAFDKRVFIAYPTLPRDVTDQGRASFGGLLQTHSLSKEYLSAQINAYAAGTVLAEALKRAGRNLSRDKLIDALESLDRFETGLTPPVTFTLNEHAGARGSYVLRLELAERRYSQVDGWHSLR
jgi:ABC-type branched-subunit amino acid transport system substrate-binding protein